jgi:hypothetical protein
MRFSHVPLVLLTSIGVTGSRPATAAPSTEARMVWSWTVPIPGSMSTPYPPSIGGSAAHVGSDAQGNTLAIWAQPLPPEGVQERNQRIAASRFTRATGWGTPVVVSDPSGYASGESFAVNASGVAMVVWQETPTSRLFPSAVRARRFLPNSGWEATTVTLAESGAWVRVVLDAEGNATVIWTDYSGSEQILSARRFVPGAGWQETVQVGRSFRPPVLAVDGSGNVIAAWVDETEGRSALKSSRFVPGAGWSSPTLLAQSADAYSLRLAMGSAGTPPTMWQNAGLSSPYS